MSKKHIYVMGYVLAVVLLGRSLILSMIYSTMETSFPNSQFILSLIIVIVLSWIVGLTVRGYINKTARGDKKIESNLKSLFFNGTILATVCLLGLFIVD